jgi:hypothetical protein
LNLRGEVKHRPGSITKAVAVKRVITMAAPSLTPRLPNTGEVQSAADHQGRGCRRRAPRFRGQVVRGKAAVPSARGAARGRGGPAVGAPLCGACAHGRCSFAGKNICAVDK